MRNPALAYRQFSVQGATPLALVVMLYDGAITFLQQALAALEAGDIQKKCDRLKRALAIFAQLEGSLNFEQGGEVARTLKALYVHARAQALKANLENSTEMLRTLVEEFGSVRDAWREAEGRGAAPNPSLPAVGSTLPAPSAEPLPPSSSQPAESRRPPARNRFVAEDWSEAGSSGLSVFD
jgi:flagellar protein FliS